MTIDKPPVNDIDTIMSLDPLDMSKADLDVIIAKDNWYDKQSINAIKAEWILRQATLVDGCLISHYKPSKVGYPKMNGTTYVHRFICSVIKGPIPEGMYVMHSCDNRRCIHPDHISANTPTANNLDMIAKGRQGKTGGAKPRLFSDRQKQEIKDLYDRGFTQRDIAASFDTSQGVIWHYLNDTHKEKDHV